MRSTPSGTITSPPWASIFFQYSFLNDEFVRNANAHFYSFFLTTRNGYCQRMVKITAIATESAVFKFLLRCQPYTCLLTPERSRIRYQKTLQKMLNIQAVLSEALRFILHFNYQYHNP